MIMVYPSVLLSALTPLIFITPPSSHDRNGYGEYPSSGSRDYMYESPVCPGPLAPKISSKLRSFQAIVREKPLF